MTGRDPLREHIANPRGGRQSIRPVIDSVGRILTEGRKVTPIGIAVSISLPLALIFGVAFWVLGKDGIVQITSAWGESAEANRELAKEVAGLRADLEAYSARTEGTQKALSLTNYRQGLICDFAAEQNKGRPRSDWCGPPGQGTRFYQPPLGALTPLLLTDAPYTPQ
jgi:hypothetical protein